MVAFTIPGTAWQEHIALILGMQELPSKNAKSFKMIRCWDACHSQKWAHSVAGFLSFDARWVYRNIQISHRSPQFLSSFRNENALVSLLISQGRVLQHMVRLQNRRLHRQRKSKLSGECREQLCGRRPNSYVLASWQKMGWALFKKDKLRQLRDELHFKLSYISLLFGTAQMWVVSFTIDRYE